MITLKRATLEDKNEVKGIEQSANSKTYAARVDEDEIKNYIQNDFVFLIKEGEKTVGLVSFETPNEEVAHCNGLVIYPEFRGRGFGREAMTLVLKEMSKYPRMELVVHPHNNSAISLYLSLGFIIESWKDDYFGDGQPRIMMAFKRIDS